jgi:hypothetical protein
MMITADQIRTGQARQTLKILSNGGSGTGKTYLGFTFPKIAYIGTEPNGLDTARSNPTLLDNLVWAEEFIPSMGEDIKATFERMETAIAKAHADQAKGEVETLFLDNFTYLAENRWIYLGKYELLRTSSGVTDTRGMYGILSRWLYNFTLTRLLSFKGNVVVSCHEQTEGDEAMEAKTDKSMTIAPAILGGFRDKVAGMFSASIYLEKKRLSENKYRYSARCQAGNQRAAKNRYNLPEIVEDVNYRKIIDSIGQANLINGAKSPTT